MSYLIRWKILVGIVIFIFVIEYSPLIIPPGQYKPFLLGLPYSLWLGIIFATVVVFLTYIGSRIFMKVIEKETNT